MTHIEIRDIFEAAALGYSRQGKLRPAIACYKASARMDDLDELEKFRYVVWFDNDQVALARGRAQTRRNWQREPHRANVQLRLF